MVELKEGRRVRIEFADEALRRSDLAKSLHGKEGVITKVLPNRLDALVRIDDGEYVVRHISLKEI